MGSDLSGSDGEIDNLNKALSQCSTEEDETVSSVDGNLLVDYA